MKKKSVSPFKMPALKAENQPATRKMLSLVRDELRSEIRTSRLESARGLGEVRVEMDQLSTGLLGRMDQLSTELRGEMKQLSTELRSEMSMLRDDMSMLSAGMKSEFSEFREEMRASNHLLHLKLEEQAADNRIVLEGLQMLWQRQDRFEAGTDKRLNRLESPGSRNR